MNRTLFQSVQRLLLSKKINIAEDYLAERLMRHPNYPSALCVSEVLNDLGLDSVVVKIEKHLLDQVPFPVLAHVKTNGGEFVLIESLKKLRKLRKSFEEIWDGILLGVEAPEGWTHSRNETHTERQGADSVIGKYATLAFTGLAVVYSLLDFTWLSFLLFIVTSLGMIFAWSSVCNELGVRNKVSEQFCGSLTTCSSSGNTQSKRILGFGFSDFAMLWFLISFAVLTLMKVTASKSLWQILFAVSSLALLTIPVSLYLQWRVKKEWCPLCLAIAACVLGQFFILLADSWTNGFLSPTVNDVMFFVLLCMGAALVWHSYRSIKEKQLLDSAEKNHSLKLYFDKNVFDRLLKASLALDVAPWEHEIQLGNKDAALQITVVSNPFCGPCGEAHRKLDELLDIYDVGLQVRFVLNAADAQDKRTKVVRQILQNLVLRQEDKIHCREVLNTWYLNLKLEQFETHYPEQNEVDVSSTLIQHDRWATYARVNRTPTILINGYLYPEPYRIEDLRELIPLIIRS